MVTGVVDTMLEASGVCLNFQVFGQAWQIPAPNLGNPWPHTMDGGNLAPLSYFRARVCTI